MPVEYQRFLRRWLAMTLSVMVAAAVVPGIRCESLSSLIFAALVLGVLNALFRNAKIILGLMSFGLMTLFINMILLALTGSIVGGFEVEGFWSVLFGALIISFAQTFFTGVVVGGGGGAVGSGGFSTHASGKTGRKEGPGGGGPIIDV